MTERVCIRCGHPESEHESKGVISPCTREDAVVGGHVNCTCYDFIYSDVVAWLRELARSGKHVHAFDLIEANDIATITQLNLIRRRMS